MTCGSSVCCLKPFFKSDSNTYNQRQKNPKIYVKHESFEPPFFSLLCLCDRGAREHSVRPQVSFTGITNFRRALRGHIDQVYFKAQMYFKMGCMGLFFFSLSHTDCVCPWSNPGAASLATHSTSPSLRPPKLFTQVELDGKGGLHIIRLSLCDSVYWVTSTYKNYL